MDGLKPATPPPLPPLAPPLPPHLPPPLPEAVGGVAPAAPPQLPPLLPETARRAAPSARPPPLPPSSVPRPPPPPSAARAPAKRSGDVIPLWVIALVLGMVALSAYALRDLKSALRDAVALERAQQADRAGRSIEAAKAFEALLKTHPSDATLLRLAGLAYFHARQYRAALLDFRGLEGRDLAKSDVAQVNAAIDAIRKAQANDSERTTAAFRNTSAGHVISGERP